MASEFSDNNNKFYYIKIMINVALTKIWVSALQVLQLLVLGTSGGPTYWRCYRYFHVFDLHPLAPAWPGQTREPLQCLHHQWQNTAAQSHVGQRSQVQCWTFLSVTVMSCMTKLLCGAVWGSWKRYCVIKSVFLINYITELYSFLWNITLHIEHMLSWFNKTLHCK